MRRYGRVVGCLVLVFVALGLCAPVDCGAEPIRIYLDADQSGARSSSLSIERGIRTALSAVDFRLDGREVEIVLKNHRGNSNRSKLHLDEYLADGIALALFAGLHSPPLLAHRDYINTRGILVLDPWAAAGPITRFPSAENWIFRLSVDDTKAGFTITEFAVGEGGTRKPALLLEETGWGKSNEATMKAACVDLGVEPAGVFWFNWGLGVNGARILLRDIMATGADAVLLVGNAPEAKAIIQAMASLPAEQRLPFYSHWGLTGGDFADEIGPDIRGQISLHFLQTSFSFISRPENPLGRTVLARACALFPEVVSAGDIKAPTGFIHAYDLTCLLIAAVEEVGLTGDILEDRRRIRTALEHLEEPVDGLIRTYRRPFRPFDAETDPDAHEALGRADLRMARYADDNSIHLVGDKTPDGN
ncbi:MAG: ABC transporter substrate-binding protein [bacterium]|nr:ABC transporter substrate-binding protein [bacterium]